MGACGRGGGQVANQYLRDKAGRKLTNLDEVYTTESYGETLLSQDSVAIIEL